MDQDQIGKLTYLIKRYLSGKFDVDNVVKYIETKNDNVDDYVDDLQKAIEYYNIRRKNHVATKKGKSPGIFL
jgi:t-SNARE complex subunit (syntaxin)